MPETLEETVNSVKNALAKDRKRKAPADDGCDGESLLDEDPGYEEEEATSASASLKFGDDIKLLLISSTPLRVICHFLGVNGVSDVKNAPFQSIPMIAFLLQERLSRFMKTKGYTFAGEIAFDQNGNPVPVSKHAWNLRGNEISFTNSGYMFYDAGTGRTKDNVVMNVFTSMGEVKAGIQCYAETGSKAKRLLNDLEAYAKKDNCMMSIWRPLLFMRLLLLANTHGITTISRSQSGICSISKFSGSSKTLRSTTAKAS